MKSFQYHKTFKSFKMFKFNQIKKFKFNTVETIGDGSCFYRAVVAARYRRGEEEFKEEEAAVRTMREEIQEYVRKNQGRFEGGLMQSAIEEGFVGSMDEMCEYAINRIKDMDAWAGQEAIQAYSEIKNIQFQILRPDGMWNEIGEGDTTIELFYKNFNHYEPIVVMTEKEKNQTKASKFRRNNKKTANELSRLSMKRKRAEKPDEKEEEEKKKKKKKK